MSKLNVVWKLMSVLVVLWCSSCIRDTVQDCPPLQVTLVVKDKNYFNIDDAQKLGLAERKAEDLPFRDYIKTLYYVVYNEQGEIVAERKNADVTGDGQQEIITLPSDLPYGKYRISVWGNMQSEEPLGADATIADMEKNGAAENDIYLAGGTFDYQYGKEKYQLGLERVKGDLMIKAEGIPDNIDFSVKTIEQVFGTVDNEFHYTNLTDVNTSLVWNKKNEIQSETLLCPSPGFEGSTLHVAFIDRSQVNVDETSLNQDGNNKNGTSVLVPQDVRITMGRNELTILRYVYDTVSDKFKIYVRVNDNWELLHGMELD